MARFSRRRFFIFLSSVASAISCKTLGIGTSKPSGKTEAAEFDYIVVGSGAGGGPLAVNLAKAGFKTLLLEAGTDQGSKDVYKIPAFHPQSSEDPDMSWDFYVKHFNKDSDDQKDSKYVDEKGILYPRAGTVGGCTAHNAMIMVYPLQKDWQQLAEDIGDPSYNPKVMRRYFQFCERADYSSTASRKKGWLPVRLASPFLIAEDSALIGMLLAALRSVISSAHNQLETIKSVFELVTNPDSNADTLERDQHEGLVMIPTSITPNGQRFSTRDLIMNQVGKNLTLRTGCLVTQVLFKDNAIDTETPEAIGVEYILGEKIYKASKNPQPDSNERLRVYANREVILAGGTFNTPQILMLSGIGPKQDLQSFATENPDYKVILDRPGVGYNLQDRYELGVVTETIDPVEVIKDCRFLTNTSDPCYQQWQKNRGPYTSNGAIIGIFKKSEPSLRNADLFIFLLPTDFHGYFPKYSEKISSSKNSMTWAILKANTHNRAGTVALKSLDPTETPNINFKYYQDGTDRYGQSMAGDETKQIPDLEAIVSGIEFVRSIVGEANRLTAAKRFGDAITDILGATPQPYFDEVIPGWDKSNRSKLRDWARHNSWGHHACGTCKMGQSSDPMAVVDSKFRVIGTKGLRIVDASVFPRIPGYFIVSSVYTMSERATDEILADAGVRRRVELGGH